MPRSLKIAIIVHVFYPEFWDELASCIHRVDVPYDLFITYDEESKVSVAKRDFPDAYFIKSENVGFDIWPFIKVLNSLDLTKYSHILKLHTKRNIQFQRTFIGGINVAGTRWRRLLLSFISSDVAWAETRRLFRSYSNIGMVVSPFLILGRNDCGEVVAGTFDKALLLGSKIGLTGSHFVAGTMFIVRADVLSYLQGRWNVEDFKSEAFSRDGTLAHVIERLICFCVTTKGLRIASPFETELEKLRCDIANLEGGLKRGLHGYVPRCMKSFVFSHFKNKLTKRGYFLSKLFGIPVWHKKIMRDSGGRYRL